MITGTTYLSVNDGTDTPTTACEALQDNIAGGIAFLDEGACQYGVQALNAQNAGASAVIVCAEADALLMAPGDSGVEVTIPAYMISAADCASIRTAGNGTVTIVKSSPSFPENQTVFWGADGEGTFTGDLGDWDVVDYTDCPNAPAGFTLWQWNATGSASNGAYANGLAAINSATSCTGTALFNSDFYDNAGTAGNFGNGDCATNQEGALISPAMDLSGLSTELGLAVQFYQGVRQFQSQYYVGWSTDGGMTWDSTEVNTDIITNSTFVSRLEAVQIPSEVLGNSDVRIKFSIVGNYYFWILDDIRLVELEAYNLQVDPFYAIPPNSATPASQVSSFGFLADVRNRGALDQENVVLNMTIFSPNGEVIYTDDLDYGTIPADSLVENQAFNNLFTPPTEIGTYTGIYTINSDNEDFDFSNNQQSFTFAITDTVFAKDFGTQLTDVAPNFDNVPTWSYGNHFYVPNGEGYRATSVTFGIGNPVEAVGLFALPALLKWDDTNEDGTSTADERELITFLEYEITGEETPNSPITLNFGEDAILEDDSEYLLMIAYTGPIRATAVTNLSTQYSATTLLSDSLQLGRGLYAGFFGNTDDFINGEFTSAGNVPFVRMHINTIGVAVEEVLAIENKVELFPNPATEELSVHFDLVEITENVRLGVTDATGRIISQRSFKNIQRNTFNFDVSSLSNGVYQMEIITATGRRTERFLITR